MINLLLTAKIGAKIGIKCKHAKKHDYELGMAKQFQFHWKTENIYKCGQNWVKVKKNKAVMTKVKMLQFDVASLMVKNRDEREETSNDVGM